MHNHSFYVYLAVSAGVTYLIRMLPLVLIKRKITNRFLLSFLHYIPYAVLTVMTVPACFYATGSLLPAVVGFLAALVLAWCNKSLPIVAAAACGGALITDLVLTYALPLIGI